MALYFKVRELGATRPEARLVAGVVWRMRKRKGKK